MSVACANVAATAESGPARADDVATQACGMTKLRPDLIKFATRTCEGCRIWHSSARENLLANVAQIIGNMYRSPSFDDLSEMLKSVYIAC
jgi:hypothetical protein